jgi:competence protein ComEC
MNERAVASVVMPPLSRHPLLIIVSFFIAGCWIGMTHPWSLNIVIAISVLSAVLWIFLFLLSARNSSWLIPSTIVLGVTAGAAACVSATIIAQQDYEGVEVLREIIESREEAMIRGRVASEPSVTRLRHGGARVRFTFIVKEVPFEHDNVRIPDSIVRVDWYGPESMADNVFSSFKIPREGEGWQLSGRMREIKMRSAVPLVTLSIRGRENRCKRFPELDASPFVSAIWKLRSYAGSILAMGVEKEEHRERLSIIRAMTLGFRSDLPYGVVDFFRLSGTVHVFSISGLHVGIIAGLVMGVLAVFPISSRTRFFAFCTAIILYTVAVGARSSAVRACVMSLMFFSAPLLNRKTDSISALSAAAIFILAYDPRQVVNLGFIFSFSCTAGILTLVPVVRALNAKATEWIINKRKNEVDVAGIMETAGLAKKANKQRKIMPFLLKKLVSVVSSSMAVSLAAWMASAPLTAMIFGQMTPVSILCNLLIVPLATLIVVLAAFSMMAGIVFPYLAEVLNKVNLFITGSMIEIARLFSNIPGGNFAVDKWSMIGVMMWYIAMFAFYFLVRAIVTTRSRNT